MCPIFVLEGDELHWVGGEALVELVKFTHGSVWVKYQEPATNDDVKGEHEGREATKDREKLKRRGEGRLQHGGERRKGKERRFNLSPTQQLCFQGLL